jgi:2-amino-4-hydroxy-6-hydroxymethyldihydropteridine diphosphokinase
VTRVFLGVGSNLGDRAQHLEAAKALLQKLPETRFLKSSSVLETEPVGGPPRQGKYLNAVWEIETALPPRELKDKLLQIESRLGRRRGELNAPREIDLDILFCGDQIVAEEKLKIPHPRLHERAFVLVPLVELAPEFIHPKMKKSVKELWESYQQKTLNL